MFLFYILHNTNHMCTVIQETIRPVNKTRESQNINRHYWQKPVSERAGISSRPEESSVLGCHERTLQMYCVWESHDRGQLTDTEVRRAEYHSPSCCFIQMSCEWGWDRPLKDEASQLISVGLISVVQIFRKVILCNGRLFHFKMVFSCKFLYNFKHSLRLKCHETLHFSTVFKNVSM